MATLARRKVDWYKHFPRTHAARRGDDRQRGSLVLRRAGSLWNRRACRRRAAPAPLG
ncbi:hypothetical protein BN9982_1800002 [Mycobacterium tuberculosis]|nr:hypothetical protein BN9982_1800002 [Mycobacterium tuberculosis]